MTLILGINCEDCIILASDGISTSVNIQDWVQQPTKKKIEIFDGDFVIGCAGIAGLNDKIMNNLHQLYLSNNKFINISKLDLIKKIEYRIEQTIKDEIKRHKAYTSIFQKASEPESKEQLGCIVSFPYKDKLLLMSIDYVNGTCTTNQNIFVAIGWFSVNTLSFLSFIRKYFCKADIPTKKEAIFAAKFGMKYAIDLSTLKLDEPVRIYIFERTNDKWLCKEFANEELITFNDKIFELEKYFKNFLD